MLAVPYKEAANGLVDSTCFCESWSCFVKEEWQVVDICSKKAANATSNGAARDTKEGVQQ